MSAGAIGGAEACEAIGGTRAWAWSFSVELARFGFCGFCPARALVETMASRQARVTLCWSVIIAIY